MKKKTVLLSFIILFCTMAYGQDSKVIVGVELMPSLTWLKFPLTDVIVPRLVFAGGVSVEYGVNSVFSVKSGLAYVRKGTKGSFTKYDNGEPLGEVKTKSDYDYLVIPLLASFATEGKTKIFINIGPYAGYLISYTQKFSAVARLPKTKNIYILKQKIDYGLSGGVGIRIPFGEKIMMDIAGRGDLGLRELNEFESTAKHISVGLLVGLKYKI